MSPSTCAISHQNAQVKGNIAPNTSGKSSISVRRNARLATYAPYTVRLFEVRGGAARFVGSSIIPQGGTVEVGTDDDEADEKAVIKALLGSLPLRSSWSTKEDSDTPAPSTIDFAEGYARENTLAGPMISQRSFSEDEDDVNKLTAIERWLQNRPEFEVGFTELQAHSRPNVSSSRPGEVWHEPFGLLTHFHSDNELSLSRAQIPFVSELESAVRDQLTFRKKKRIVCRLSDGTRSVLGQWDDLNVGEWLADKPSPEAKVVLEYGDEGELRLGIASFPHLTERSQPEDTTLSFEECFTVVQGDTLELAADIVRGGTFSIDTTADSLSHSDYSPMDVDLQGQNTNPVNQDAISTGSSSTTTTYYLLIKRHLERDIELLHSPHNPQSSRISRSEAFSL